MAIRISTTQLFNQGSTALLNNQAGVSQTQLQLSKGTRILKPSDDPVGTALKMDLQKQIDVAKQFVDNSERANTRLEIEETSLQNVTNILQRIRELTLQASNATLNAADRQSISIEIQSRFEELVGVANTQLASGEYLFAGFRSNVKPFTVNGTGSVDYAGDQGKLFINVNSSVQVQSGNNGHEVFMDIRTGNGSFVTTGNGNNLGTGVISAAVLNDPTVYSGDSYTVDFSENGSGNIQYQITGANSGPLYTAPLPLFDEGATVTMDGVSYSISGYPADGDSFTIEPSFSQDVFATINQITHALSLPNSSSELQATFLNAINLGMQNLDQAMNKIDEVRSSVGSRLNVVDSESEINASLIVEAESSLSLVQDLDYAEAITELNKRTLALQAAQQSFAQVQNLSLFEFI